MEEIKKSDFRFDGYIIKHSEININKEIYGVENFKIEITPKGVKDKDKFTLTLVVDIFDENNSIKINLLVDAFFRFRDNIPMKNAIGFCGFNAPAIIFPYIRGYISMLTSLSGRGTITLPTLNLTEVGKELISNITEIE